MNAGADDNPDSGEPAEADDFTEDDDGEDGEADDFEVTESDREKDRNLAIQFATAALTGAATLAGVVPGALATMFAPIAAAIMTAAVQHLGRRRAEHAADTLLDAADAAGVPLGEFMDKAVADDRRHELFARTMRVAQDTARRDKRRALGRALAAGVMGDDARIDEELLFIRAIDDLDEMHIRVLGRLVDGRRLTAGDIASADPGLGAGVPALLNQLQSHGLIDSRSPVTPGGAMTPEPLYFITELGRGFLDRLRDDPD
jgi:hypothetical protein